jgi:hypothetical protein
MLNATPAALGGYLAERRSDEAQQSVPSIDDHPAVGIAALWAVFYALIAIAAVLQH